MRVSPVDDLRAFSAIYDRHAAASHGLAYRMLRERAAAEDVVQEAFIALWRCRHDYRPERGSLRGWLLTITRNRAIDAIRRARHETRTELRRRPRPGGARADRRAGVAPPRGREHRHRAVRAARDVSVKRSSSATSRPHPDRDRGAARDPTGDVKGRLRLALRKARRAARRVRRPRVGPMDHARVSNTGRPPGYDPCIPEATAGFGSTARST